MAETYCGKVCADCPEREALCCPGCKTGPGREDGGICELAQCCHSGGNETCATCNFRANCRLHQYRDRQPEYQRTKLNKEREHQEILARRAPFLGKWLGMLFLVHILTNVTGLLELDSFRESLPQVFLMGQVSSTLLSVVVCLILLRLGVEEERYRYAGFLQLVMVGLDTLTMLFGEPAETSGLSLLVGLVSVGFGLAADYNQIHAHSGVLSGVDDALAEKWTKLWTWKIRSLIALGVCLLVMVVIPFLGIVALFAILIAVVVLVVLQYVYLYKTARVFRNYTT